MNGIEWRWDERDFGFRFKSGKGRQAAEYYQARSRGEFYVVSAASRKLTAARLNELAEGVVPAENPVVVANPWSDYHREWDWIVSADGICLNYAGCLDQSEVDRREDQGVARASEYIADLVMRADAVPLSVDLVCRVHEQLMGEIYPFAGTWRTVSLHKGDGPTKWPLPPCGIEPLMDDFERTVLNRSPVLSPDNAVVFAYVSELMNEFLALHPFREGNGRTAFVLGNMILMQNDLLPLDVYDRRRDEARYYAACESGRLNKDYAPLASLVDEWEQCAIERWETAHAE